MGMQPMHTKDYHLYNCLPQYILGIIRQELKAHIKEPK